MRGAAAGPSWCCFRVPLPSAVLLPCSFTSVRLRTQITEMEKEVRRKADIKDVNLLIDGKADVDEINRGVCVCVRVWVCVSVYEGLHGMAALTRRSVWQRYLYENTFYSKRTHSIRQSDLLFVLSSSSSKRTHSIVREHIL